MAKRSVRTPLGGGRDDRQLDDHSSDLWDPRLGEVARRLLTSAVRCFATNGYHGTTTRDISSGVGLSPAAMYVHFPSKELVLYEIVRAGHERALAHVEGPGTQPGDDPTARLHRMMARYTAWHARHHVAARVCQYEYTALTAAHFGEVAALRHRTNQAFRAAVADGVAEGCFVALDVNRVVRAMLSLSIDLVRWYRLDGSDSPERLGQFYADLALTMVARPDAAERLAAGAP
ncbi:TetR/AcrR family transcriptional regulator [Acidiferrimicrobium sp. IK]|uniref:TetR/AcrR family transcriptional regulator n=1 Tax=Acidiferrimicrobium sp. IK TaxID=2871700 RepID=UPI0021CB5D20|nr:TetR/AcrR family transcriptional regulator [Acidiferrimicrobium sp. IK]MCU4186790.1 TetR/AcrR family transcriptional regulator [Acidiferrimicrobium sp. IK]